MSVELNGKTWTTWDDVRDELFTPEEIAESDRRVALLGELIKARQGKGAVEMLTLKDAIKKALQDPVFRDEWEALEMVRMYNPKNVVLDVLLVLEKHKIPVSLLDTVLADIRATVMSQPITGGSIGLPPAEYEEQERRLLRELESRKKGSEQLGNVLPGY